MITDFLKTLKDKGWTQEAIAEKAGLRQGVISKLARGGDCNVHTLVKIAEAFKVPTDFVLGRSPTRSGDNHYPGHDRRDTNDRLHIRNKSVEVIK